MRVVGRLLKRRLQASDEAVGVKRRHLDARFDGQGVLDSTAPRPGPKSGDPTLVVMLLLDWIARSY